MNNADFNKALDLLAQANTLTKRCAGLLNCAEGDIKIVLAQEFEARGVTAETVTSKQGASTLFTYKKGSADSLTADTDRMKELLTEMGVEIPMKARKGARPTLIIK